MANFERVDSYLDMVKVEAEHAKFIDLIAKDKAALMALYDTINKYKGSTMTNIAENTDKLTEAMKKSTTATEASTKANVEHVKSTKEYTKSQQAAEQSTKQTTGAINSLNVVLDQNNKTLAGNIEAKRRLENANKSLKIDQKEDLALLKNNTITRKEYSQRIQASTILIEKNKIAIADLTKTIKQQATAQIGSQALKGKEASAYKQLTIASAEASLKAKDYAASLGALHPKSVQAAADALMLRNRLKDIDMSVGETGKNVGNYANDIEKVASKGGLSKAYGVLRTAANILPGIGIAGIFGAIFAGIGLALDKLGLFSEKITLFAQNLTNVNEVVKEGNKEGGKQITTLRLLYNAATDVTLSTETRLKAAKELQKEYPATFKNLSTEAIMLGDAKKYYDDLSIAILKTARAAAAKNKLDELAAQKLDIEFQKQKIRNATGNEAVRKANELDELNKSGTEGLDAKAVEALKALGKELVSEDVRTINKRKDVALKGQDDLIKSIEAQEQFLINFVGKDALVDAIVPPPGEVKERIEDLTNEILAAQKRRLDAIAKMSRLELELEAKKQKEIVDNDKVALEDRLLNLQFYTDTKKEIAKRDQDNELEDTRLKLDEITKIEGISVGKRTSEQKKLLITKQALLAEEALSNFKYGIEIQSIEVDKIAKIRELREKETEEIRKSEELRVKTVEEAAKKKYEAQKRAIEDISSYQKIGSVRTELNGLKELAEAYQAGTITVEEYNKKKEELSKAASLRVLNIDLEKLNKEYDAAIANGGDIVKAFQAVEDKKLEIQKASNEKLIAEEDEAKRQRIKVMREILAYEQEAAKLAIGLTQAATTTELNRIQEQKDASDTYYSKELENIQNSSASEAEKAARSTLLKNQQEAKGKEFDRKKREAQTRQAEFEKKIAIFQIVLNTAAAIIEALPNVPLAIFAGVQGAVQLAIALATPIPKYEHGTDNAPGGWALTDEKGPEMYIEPGGKTYMGNDKPTYRRLISGTKVIPSYKITESLRKQAMRQTAAMFGGAQMYGQQDGNSQLAGAITDSIVWQTYEMKKALSKGRGKMVVHNHINMDRVNYLNKKVYN